MQRQVPRGRSAGVEVLVEPLAGGDEHARLVPRRHHLLLPFLPEDGVAFPRGNDDDPARAVAVGLLVGAGGEHRHVARHFGVGKGHQHAVAAGASAAAAVELVPGSHVGKEVAVPEDAAAAAPGPGGVAVPDELGLGIEFAAPGQVVLALVPVVEEERRVGVQGHGQRQVAVAQDAHRPVAAHVAHGVVVVVRDLEQAPGLPLEAVLRPVFAQPHRGHALALEHIDQLVQGELHPRQGLSGRDLLHHGRGHSLLPHELDEGALAAALLPPAQLNRAQVLDEVTPVDRHADRGHPVVVGVLLDLQVGSGGIVGTRPVVVLRHVRFLLSSAGPQEPATSSKEGSGMPSFHVGSRSSSRLPLGSVK